MVPSNIDNDEAVGTEKGEGASAPKKKKRRAAPIPKVYRCPKQCDLPDKVKLEKVMPFLLTTTVLISMTGVNKQFISTRTASIGQSVYKCLYDPEACDYQLAQMSGVTNHLWHKHTGHCIQCRLCGKCSFRACDITRHLQDLHRDHEQDRFKPIPPLEGNVEETTGTELQQQIDIIKEEPNVANDGNSDSDIEILEDVSLAAIKVEDD